MFKIAITGPESSGKTALTIALAKQLKAVHSEEYAREYLLQRGGKYQLQDLDIIAKGQLINNQPKNIQDKFFVCDTEILVMKVWSEFKFNTCSDFIIKSLKNQKFNLYVLCKPDIEWEDDPLRENPLQRDELFAIYHNELIKMNVDFIIVEGDVNHRIQKVLGIIEK